MGNSPIFNVSNSPLTQNGNIIVALNKQPANEFWGGPQVGDNATPTFRQLISGDLPGLNGVASFLRDGGQVVWIQDYDYTVSAANYVVLGTQYHSPQTDITLDPAHATLDRIDLVVVDTNSSVVVITGTPNVNPQEPSYDPETQLPLAFILVTANTTQPPCASYIVVYTEDAGPPGEWAATASSGSINVGSTSNPRSPSTKCIEATTIVTDESISLTPLNPVSIDGATQLNFYIRSKFYWDFASISIQIAMSTGEPTTLVLLQDGAYGFDSSTTGVYQQISIPLSDFNIPSGLLVGGLKFFLTPNLRSFGFYLDDIQIATNCIGTFPDGKTPGIDTVLAVGQALSADRTIDIGGNVLQIMDGVDSLLIVNSTEIIMPLLSGNGEGLMTIDDDGILGFVEKIRLDLLTDALGNNAFDNGDFGQNWQWNALTGFSPGLTLSSISTAAIGNSQIVLKVDLSGANATATQTTYGIVSSNTHTGTASTNIGGFFTASGGSNNYALKLVDGTQGAGKVLTSDANGNASWATASSFALTNGSGTTANGTAVDLGGTLTGNTTIVGADKQLALTFNTLAGTSGLDLSSTSIAAASNLQKILNISLSGTNGNTTQTTYALDVSNSHLGTASTNIAARFASTNGTAANYAVIVPAASGYVGIGTSTPGQPLTIDYNLGFASGASMQVTNNGSAGIATKGIVLDGRAIWGSATTGVGLYGSVTSGHGIFALATTGNAIYGQSDSGTALDLIVQPSSTNTIVTSTTITRSSSGTAADGIGNSIDFYLRTASGVTEISNQIINKWTTAAHATRTSQFIITGVDSAVTADLFTLSGSGALQLNKYGIGTFSGDVAFILAVDPTGNIIETTAGAGDVTLAGVQTLTNKRITKRVQSVTDAATITPNADSDDCVDITAAAQAFLIDTPSGTPTNKQTLIITIKDDGSPQAITYGSGLIDGGVTRPTTTTASKIMTIGFIYDTANALNKWLCVSSVVQA